MKRSSEKTESPSLGRLRVDATKTAVGRMVAKATALASIGAASTEMWLSTAEHPSKLATALGVAAVASAVGFVRQGRNVARVASAREAYAQDVSQRNAAEEQAKIADNRLQSIRKQMQPPEPAPTAELPAFHPLAPPQAAAQAAPHPASVQFSNQ